MGRLREVAGPRPGVLPAALTGTGPVAAAAVAHVSGGGTRPSWPLLVVLAVALSTAARHSPRRLRTFRARVAIGALLQPVLHGVFEAIPHGPVADADSMLVAHALAAVAAAWWTARGVDAVVAAPRRVLAAMRPPRPLLSSAVDTTVSATVVTPPPLRRWVRATPRRGPPGLSVSS